MGRTNPTYRDFLRRIEEDWQPFRRGLRRRYQPDFDRLFDRARDHADAAGYANGTDPEFAFFLSVLLAQEAEIRTLRERLDGDSGRLDGEDGRPDREDGHPDSGNGQGAPRSGPGTD